MNRELERFLEVILPKAVELEKKLPQIHLRLTVENFLNHNTDLWNNIQSKITARYPQYESLLNDQELAFRVVYRPTDNNATLPGFDDKSFQTRTLSLRYGMDYQPEVGEYVGMTPSAPWAFYMLPDIRYAQPDQFHTIVYVYNNQGHQLVKADEATVGPLPRDNYLTDFLEMMITISWVSAPNQPEIDPLVHDSTLESIEALAIRAGIFEKNFF